MNDKVYTIAEIKSIAAPIAARHGVSALYLFGSYARGEATPTSDLDFRIDKGKNKNILQLGGLLNDLEDSFHKSADVLTTQMLSDELLSGVRREEVLLYKAISD